MRFTANIAKERTAEITYDSPRAPHSTTLRTRRRFQCEYSNFSMQSLKRLSRAVSRSKTQITSKKLIIFFGAETRLRIEASYLSEMTRARL